MERLIEFVGNHAILSSAFVAILGLLLWHEIRIRASGIRAMSPTQAVALVNDQDAVFLDVREPAEVKAAVRAGIERFGGIDVLVNNAAGNFIRPSMSLAPKGASLAGA